MYGKRLSSDCENGCEREKEKENNKQQVRAFVIINEFRGQKEQRASGVI